MMFQIRPGDYLWVCLREKDGGQRVNFTAFHEALLSAKGVVLGSGSASIGKGGRKLS